MLTHLLRTFNGIEFVGLEPSPEAALSQIPAFLRVLLSTDGTVTKSLEAYFWEPVEVQKIEQEILGHAPEYCLLEPSSEIIRRCVALLGLNTGKEFATAESYIDGSALTPELKGKLEKGELGIGELLREQGMDTYRQIVKIGWDREQERVWRKYLIRRQGRAFIEINERFNLSLFA